MPKRSVPVRLDRPTEPNDGFLVRTLINFGGSDEAIPIVGLRIEGAQAQSSTNMTLGLTGATEIYLRKAYHRVSGRQIWIQRQSLLELGESYGGKWVTV